MVRVEKFPHVDGHLGWLETAPSSSEPLGSQVQGRHAFDVAIIGAGFTGISTALRFAELNPSARIALIDALRVGEGTSGRNAGFLIDVPHNLDGRETNADEARALFGLNTFAIRRLREYKDRFDIPHWCEAGKYLAAHERENLGALKEFTKMLDAAGFDHEVLEGAALQRRLGTGYYLSAVYTPGNVLVNPAALVRGLVKALPKSVTLFERSPVIGIEYGSPHTLQFVGGDIRARSVIQATNSFSEEFGKLANRLAPVFTYASLTRRLSDEEIRNHFEDIEPWGVTSAHPAGSTVRFTVDRRIFVRNTLHFLPELTASPQHLQEAWQQHRRSFEARFPGLESVDFEYTWGGMLAMTLNHAPVFSALGDGIYIMAGCNGVGVVKGTYLGYYMAEYIAGCQSKNLDFILKNAGPSWVPPDPFRTIGARARLGKEASHARGEV